MRKLLLLFTITLLLSCSKDDSTTTNTPSYYIKAKFNGEQKVFSNLVIGQKGLNGNNLVHLTLGAVNGSSFPAYDIEIWNLEGTISAGIYSEANFDIESRYALDGFTRYNNFSNDIEDYKVTITSISATEVKGNFEGTITKNAGENIIITEGEFYVPLKD